jgi:hypothetical protein
MNLALELYDNLLMPAINNETYRLACDKGDKGAMGKECLPLTRVVPRENNLSSLAIIAGGERFYFFYNDYRANLEQNF